jgi:S-adenosylmethionine synthetase
MENAFKVMVTGATGLLGKALAKQFNSANYELFTLAYKRAKNRDIKLDITDRYALKNVIYKYRPQVIIHTVAEKHPEICEKFPDKAIEINVKLTKTIAEFAREIGCWVLYISTDYVFDGQNPPYRPNSPTNPLNSYGKTKLAGEKVLLEALPSSCVLRVPVMYGPFDYLAESSVTSIANLMLRDEAEISLDDVAKRYPTLTTDIASICQQMIEYKRVHEDFSGVFHWSAEECLTRYQMGLIIAEILGIPRQRLQAFTHYDSLVMRPYNTALDCSDLKQLNIQVKNKSFAENMKTVLEMFQCVPA